MVSIISEVVSSSANSLGRRPAAQTVGQGAHRDYVAPTTLLNEVSSFAVVLSDGSPLAVQQGHVDADGLPIVNKGLKHYRSLRLIGREVVVGSEGHGVIGTEAGFQPSKLWRPLRQTRVLFPVSFPLFRSRYRVLGDTGSATSTRHRPSRRGQAFPAG